MPGKKRYTMVLNFGYAENGHVGYVPFVSRQTFKDAKEALVHLANYLKDAWEVEHKVEPKKCCIATKEKDPDAEYCTKCRMSVGKQEFDEEDFIDNFLMQLNTDYDTLAGLIDWDREAPWECGHLEGAPNPRFVYNAELVIAAVLGYPKHEDRTWETICKNRTKSRKDSFSYW